MSIVTHPSSPLYKHKARTLAAAIMYGAICEMVDHLERGQVLAIGPDHRRTLLGIVADAKARAVRLDPELAGADPEPKTGCGKVGDSWYFTKTYPCEACAVKPEGGEA